MMRMCLAAVLAACGPAAAECTNGSSATFLTVEDWSLERVKNDLVSGIDIRVSIKSHAAKPFHMIDASYTFQDALGRRISGFVMNPDLAAAPGQTVETVNGYLGNEMDRALKMRREDITVFACTRAVVFDDGTKQEFK